MKIGFIITARMKSSRLKKKATLKIFDRELIAWMLDRAKLSTAVSNIVIATSTNPQDDVLEEIAKRESVDYYRGSEEDVIERLYEAAKKFDLDFFINITADCPLFGFDYFEEVISYYKKTNADLITSTDLPHGFFIYGLKTNTLRQIIENKNIKDTEVWGSLFNKEKFNVKELPVDKNLIRENFRLTVDYPEDFTFFEKVFHGLGEDTYKKTTPELIEFLDAHPEIVAINQECRDMYKKKWTEQETKTKKLG
ncbi:MAG: cytidylyltransferase domain-containing protein [Oceanihabitans sp.]